MVKQGSFRVDPNFGRNPNGNGYVWAYWPNPWCDLMKNLKKQLPKAHLHEYFITATCIHNDHSSEVYIPDKMFVDVFKTLRDFIELKQYSITADLDDYLYYGFPHTKEDALTWKRRLKDVQRKLQARPALMNKAITLEGPESSL